MRRRSQYCTNNAARTVSQVWRNKHLPPVLQRIGIAALLHPVHHGSDKGAAIWLVTAAACSCCILLYRLPLLCTACDKPLEGQEVQEQGAHEQVRGHKL